MIKSVKEGEIFLTYLKAKGIKTIVVSNNNRNVFRFYLRGFPSKNNPELDDVEYELTRQWHDYNLKFLIDWKSSNMVIFEDLVFHASYGEKDYLRQVHLKKCDILESNNYSKINGEICRLVVRSNADFKLVGYQKIEKFFQEYLPHMLN